MSWITRKIRKLRRRREKMAEEKVFARDSCVPLPRSIHLEVTWNCNLKCTMCARKDTLPGKHNLTLDEFEAVMEQFPGPRQLNFVGWGEPLMNPSFFDFLERSTARGAAPVFTTNGTLLTEQNVRRLPRRMGAVYCSVDSAVPEKYELIRVGAAFDMVKRNIALLKEIRPDVTMMIQSVLTRENAGELDELVRFAAGVRADVLSLLHLACYTEDDDKLHLCRQDAAETERVFDAARALAAQLRVKLILPPLRPQFKHCRAAWLQPYISLTGDVYPCCYTYRPFGALGDWYAGCSLDVPASQFNMGNVFKTGFREIWDGEKYRMLRRVLRDSDRPGELSIEEFNNARKRIDPAELFSYCKVCLWRWNCAC